MYVRSHEASRVCSEADPDLQCWLDLARRGDLVARGQALQSFREYLLLVATRELDPGLNSKGSASDLVQETLLRAHRRFGDYRGGSAEEWRGWLRTILINHLAEHRRRYCSTRSRRVQGEISINAQEWPIAGQEESPSRTVMRHEREEAVMAALGRLPEDYRRVVIARHYEKLSHEEIGRERGISAEAARKLWERALGRLSKELGPVRD